MSLFIVLTVGTIAFFYATGYRVNKGNLSPQGILVINSDPNGAQILINGELKEVSNANLTLPEGDYDIILKKDGFIPWQKRIKVQKEIVTELDADLFPSAPSLSAITFDGISNPIISDDGTKIAYNIVNSDPDKNGLWLLETVNLPLGFNREPRRITDLSLLDPNSTWKFSPDSREILITSKNGLFLLSTSEFKSQSNLVNIAAQREKVLTAWKQKADELLNSQLQKLPESLSDIFLNKTSNISFSPDENKILYEASASATITEGLIKPLPGSSTQKEDRNIQKGKKYVFDVKEDKNFEVGASNDTIYWLPNSRNLLIPEKDKISISDYDGTNKITLYSGSYISPNAFPSASSSRIYLLTNLGSQNSPLNLYSLSLK